MNNGMKMFPMTHPLAMLLAQAFAARGGAPAPAAQCCDHGTEHLTEEVGSTHPLMEKFKAAVMARYGGSGSTQEEAMEAFAADARKIMRASHPNDKEPTFKEKLDALKAHVGDDYFKGLLANPRVESFAAEAWERKDAEIFLATIVKICGLLNNALTCEEMEMLLDSIQPIEA